MRQWLWTWRGKCFGYREGDDLRTHDGKHAGHFHGDEVYGIDGRYLGEIKSTKRLITRSSKKSRRKTPISRKASRGAFARYADYADYAMYAGYEDFPSPGTFR